MQHFAMQKKRYLEFWDFAVCAETIFCHYVQFSWFKECENTQLANTVIVAHVEMLIHDFSEKFHDLEAMEFPSRLTQPRLVDLSAVPEQSHQESCEFQQDEVVKTIFKIEGTTM